LVGPLSNLRNPAIVRWFWSNGRSASSSRPLRSPDSARGGPAAKEQNVAPEPPPANGDTEVKDYSLTQPERVADIVTGELEKAETVIDQISANVKNDVSLHDRFSRVYHENSWWDSETRSGPGSRMDSPCVGAAISALMTVRELINFVSINDIPCGDFNWMHLCLQNMPDIRYRGFDIVPMLVEENQNKYPRYEFSALDITSAVPPHADLIFSKDFFNHLLYEDISKALKNMKQSSCQYLLATNNFGVMNEELSANIGGLSRHLDLCAPPFNLSQPLWNTHYLGLWKLPDIEIKDR
jgi:hypothetical protein